MATYTRADLERIAGGTAVAEPPKKRTYTRSDLEAIAAKARPVEPERPRPSYPVFEPTRPQTRQSLAIQREAEKLRGTVRREARPFLEPEAQRLNTYTSGLGQGGEVSGYKMRPEVLEDIKAASLKTAKANMGKFPGMTPEAVADKLTAQVLEGRELGSKTEGTPEEVAMEAVGLLSGKQVAGSAGNVALRKVGKFVMGPIRARRLAQAGEERAGRVAEFTNEQLSPEHAPALPEPAKPSIVSEPPATMETGIVRAEPSLKIKVPPKANPIDEKLREMADRMKREVDFESIWEEASSRLDDQGARPGDVARQFFDDVLPNLPQELQDRFGKIAKKTVRSFGGDPANLKEEFIAIMDEHPSFYNIADEGYSKPKAVTFAKMFAMSREQIPSKVSSVPKALEAAHGRLQSAFGTRVGGRGKPVQGVGANLGNVNWEAVGNDLVAVGRGIAKAVGDKFEPFVKRMVELYGDRVKPYLIKTWDTIRRGSGFRPALDDTTRQFMSEVQTEGSRLAAAIRVPMAEVAETLSKPEKAWLRENFYETYKAGGKAPPEMPGAQAFMDKWREVSKPIPGLYKEAGKEIGDIENYVPQRWTDEMQDAFQKGSGEYYNAWLSKVKEMNPDITTEQIEEISKRMAGRTDAGDIRAGASATKGRFFENMPSEITVGGKQVKVLETDPFKLIDQHATSIGADLARTRAAQRAGKESFSGLESDMADAIYKRHGSQAKDAFVRQLSVLKGAQHNDGLSQFLKGPVLRDVRNISNGLALSMSGLTQGLLGHFPGMAVTGGRNYAKATWKYVTGRAKADVEFARRMGAWTDRGLMEEAGIEGLTGWSGKVSKMFPKITQSDRLNNQIHKITAIASKDTLDQLVARVKTGDLKAANALTKDFYLSPERVKRMAAEGVQDADYAQVMQVATAKANLAQRLATEVPYGATLPIVTDLFAFSGMTRTLGNLTVDTLAKAGSGNVMPLVYLVGGTAVGNEARKEIMARLRDRKNKDDLAQSIFALGLMGMPGTIAGDEYYAAKSGRKDTVQALIQRRVPIWAKSLDSFKQAFQGDMKPMRRQFGVVDIAAVRLGGAKPLKQKGEKKAKSKGYRDVGR